MVKSIVGMLAILVGVARAAELEKMEFMCGDIRPGLEQPFVIEEAWAWLIEARFG